jgi:hypothetical protein
VNKYIEGLAPAQEKYWQRWQRRLTWFLFKKRILKQENKLIWLRQILVKTASINWPYYIKVSRATSYIKAIQHNKIKCCKIKFLCLVKYFAKNWIKLNFWLLLQKRICPHTQFIAGKKGNKYWNGRHRQK